MREDQVKKMAAEGNTAKPGWKDIAQGGLILAGGTARHFKTGDWRSYRPLWDSDKCTNCLRCWVYCPDMSIIISKGRVDGIKLEHCKGCGICARVCPPKVQAIEMVLESHDKEKAG